LFWLFYFFFNFCTHFIFFCRLFHALGVFQHSWSIFCQVFSSYFFNFILNLFCHFFFYHMNYFNISSLFFLFLSSVTELSDHSCFFYICLSILNIFCYSYL
jgi:hypothetical protein